MKTRADTLAALRAAIAAYRGDPGPGKWTAQNFSGYGDAVALTYEVEDIKATEDNLEPYIKTGDEPWEEWGGDDILEAAGLESFDGLGESYIDKFGAEIYASSAIIAVQDLGQVTYEGVTYMLNDQAVADIWAEGDTIYFAPAFDSDGTEYRVVWETTPEWKASYEAEEDHANDLDVDMCSLRERFGLDADWIPCDTSDETLACDWESPVSVTLLVQPTT